MIEWVASGNTTAEPDDTTLYALSNQEVDEIVRKKFKLNLVITEVENPTDWWYYSCPACWRKMTPVGNIRRCPKCHDTKERQRYRISVKAEDIDPNPENKRVIGRFIFFGENGAVLAGKDVILLAAQTKGRPDYVPPTISNIVGKKCAVTAEVKQDTLDADDGLIIFSVSRAELIGSSAGDISSSSQSIQPTCSQTTSHSTSTEADKNKSVEATPVKDIIEAASIETEGTNEPISELKKKERIHHQEAREQRKVHPISFRPNRQVIPSKQQQETTCPHHKTDHCPKQTRWITKKGL